MLERYSYVAVPIAFGLLALWFGKDVNWDLRNYHIYVAAAQLDGRSADIAPAYHNSYHNPFLFIPIFLAIRTLPPMVVGFLLGAVQGLSYIPLYLLARWFIRGRKTTVRWAKCAALALAGLLGAGNLSELGTSFSDNLLALPILVAITLVLAAHGRMLLGALAKPLLLGVLAGVLCGVAAGLKQTVGLYAVALGVACVAPRARWRNRLLLAVSFCSGIALGAALSGGPFWYAQWREYRNPMFPYFNDVFQAPEANPWHYRDLRYPPKTVTQALLSPLLPITDPLRIGERIFREWRFAALAGVAILLAGRGAVTLVVRRWRGSAARATQALASRAVGVFLLVAYALWAWMFFIYRYLIPAELLAPLAIWAGVRSLARPVRHPERVAFAVLALTVVLVRPANWGRRPWDGDYFGVKFPHVAGLDRGVVLVTGEWALGYLVPHLPAQTPLIRIEAYGDPVRHPDFPGPPPRPTALDRRARELLATHQGPIFLLARTPSRARRSLFYYGLELVRAGCTEFHAGVESKKLSICEVERRRKEGRRR